MNDRLILKAILATSVTFFSGTERPLALSASGALGSAAQPIAERGLSDKPDVEPASNSIRQIGEAPAQHLQDAGKILAAIP